MSLAPVPPVTALPGVALVVMPAPLLAPVVPAVPAEPDVPEPLEPLELPVRLEPAAVPVLPVVPELLALFPLPVRLPLPEPLEVAVLFPPVTEVSP